MHTSKIRAGAIYTDGNSAIRRVVKITDTRPSPGAYEVRDVIYEELAGRNRGKQHTLSLPQFAAWAGRYVQPADLPAAMRELGLKAWPLSAEEEKLVRVMAEEGVNTICFNPATNRDQRLIADRLVARGLAKRHRPTQDVETIAYAMDADLVAAAAPARPEAEAFPEDGNVVSFGAARQERVAA